MIENKELVIFGAGSGAVKVIRTMKNLGVEIIALADNSEAKWGTVCEDLPVINPVELKEMDCNIMIASTYQEEIEAQLKEYGIFDRLVLKEEYMKRNIESRLHEFDYLDVEEKGKKAVCREQGCKRIIFGLEEGMWLGGVENLVFMWARELKKRGMEVYIFSKMTEDLPPEDLKENVVYFDLSYERYWDSIKELTQAIYEKSPCCVIDNWENQLLQAVSVIKRFRPDAVRCVSVIHNDQYLFYRRTAYMQEYIDAIAGVSLDVVAHLRDDFHVPAEKLHYKESPIEFDKDLVKEYTLDETKPLKIGYAARITKTQKRADLMIPLIEKLNELGVYYELSIAGIGDYYEKLETGLEEKGLYRMAVKGIELAVEQTLPESTDIEPGQIISESRDTMPGGTVRYNTVKLLGWIERSEMKNFWRDKDVFFNLSDYEGSSISTLEAMSYGVVPTVTRVSGATEFICEENGYICECRDVNAIADSIAELSTDRQKLPEMGEKARRTVQVKCNKDDYIDYILQLCEM